MPRPTLASLRLAALGLALAAPTVAPAGPPETAETARPAPRKKLFGHKPHLCPDCQLKARMRADGLNAPPTAVIRDERGNVVGTGVVPGTSPAGCVACQGGSAPVVMGEAPGFASVGGGPGYAVAGNGLVPAEPAPIGVMQAGFQGAQPPTGMPGAESGVMRAGAIPPAPSMGPIGRAPRPRILSHLFGLPMPGDIGSARRERLREQHAMIRYDDTEGRVNDLPASSVYGRGAR